MPTSPSGAVKSAPSKRASSSATIRDVAKLAGVSLMTVSRAVKQPESVAKDTLARVRLAMKELKYVPNMAAVSLRVSESRLVAAIVPSLTTHMFDAMLAAFTEKLAENGYQVLVGQTQYQPEREVDLIRTTLGRRPDGILFTGAVQNKTVRDLVSASGIPFIEAGEVARRHIDMAVGISHEDMGAAVCRYLVERGRRRLAVLCGNDVRARKRAHAFQAEAQKLGIKNVYVGEAPAPTNFAAGRRLMAELANSRKQIDGIHCGSDLLAAGVLVECQSRGIDVPGQIAVVGMGNSNFAEMLMPALTSVSVDGALIGEIAANMFLKRFSEMSLESKSIDVGFSIVTRQSS